MGLNVNVQGSKGQHTFHFDDDVEVIAFGRDPDRCQVVFAPDVTAVGREHCSVRRVLGEYRLVIDQDHLVLVNREPAVDEQVLPQQCQLQLGPDGPTCLVRRVERTDMPPTKAQGHRPGQATQVQQTAEIAKKNRWASVGVLLLVLVGAYLVFRAQQQTEEDLGDLAKTAEQRRKVLDGVEARIGEMGTDLTEVRENLQEVGGDLGGLEASLGNMRVKMEEVETRLAKARPEVQARLLEARASVYMVIMVDADGAESPMGTAWVVGDGTLGTNAHVAEVRGSYVAAGGRMLVRSNTPPHHSLEVESVTIHPGYEAFDELWADYMPSQGSSAGRPGLSHSAGACDVALLHLKAGWEGRLAPPLEVADDAALAKLDAGEPVGFVGYPVESMAFRGTPIRKPTPQHQVGMVTAVTDFFGARPEAGDPAQLVQHNCPSAGGASGSPIIDARGRVVALLNAGNSVWVSDSVRVSTGAGVDFAQRVDLLRELRADAAVPRQQARTTAWKKTMKSLYEEGYLILLGSEEEQTLERARTELASMTGFRQMFETALVAKSEAAAVSWEGASRTDHRIEIADAGLYVLTAAARPAFDIDLDAWFEAADGTASEAQVSSQRSFMQYALLETTGQGTLHVNGVKLEDDCRVGFRLYRAEGTPTTSEALQQRFVQDWLSWVIVQRGASHEPVQVASGTATQSGPNLFRAGFADVPPGPILVSVAFPTQATRANMEVYDGASKELIHGNVEATVDRYFCGAWFTLRKPTSLVVVAQGQPPGVAPVVHIFRAVPEE